MARLTRPWLKLGLVSIPLLTACGSETDSAGLGNSGASSIGSDRSGNAASSAEGSTRVVEWGIRNAEGGRGTGNAECMVHSAERAEC